MSMYLVQSEGPYTVRMRLHRCSVKALLALAVFGAATAAVPNAMAADGDDHDRSEGSHWVTTWATSPASYFVYAAPIAQNQALGFSPTKYALANIQPDLSFPFPNAKTSGATAVDQTIRSIVKPDLWGRNIRIRLSNVFGDQPLTFNAVTVALQEYAANVVRGTLTPVTFSGGNSVTILPGQEIWSDGVPLSWVDDDADSPLLQGRNLAISYSIQGNSGHMTHHSGANTTRSSPPPAVAIMLTPRTALPTNSPRRLGSF